MSVHTKIIKKDGEYRVRIYVNNVAQPAQDYFTDDIKDALVTAQAMSQSETTRLRGEVPNAPKE